MKHNLKLQEKPFGYIQNGTKRIELRLYDEKRSLIDIGDEIEFTNVGTEEKLLARVIGLLKYKSFQELVADFDMSVLADTEMSKNELLDTLNGFYPSEKQARFNVLGIRIEYPLA
ncbi:ASCH domain-containing protein [Candidatus Saccharibacteria bacterium]|nr:ASCH domain-containing protein [Candidatus Saccharibacteria bacterium]